MTEKPETTQLVWLLASFKPLRHQLGPTSAVFESASLQLPVLFFPSRPPSLQFRGHSPARAAQLSVTETFFFLSLISSSPSVFFPGGDPSSSSTSLIQNKKGCNPTHTHTHTHTHRNLSVPGSITELASQAGVPGTEWERTTQSYFFLSFSLSPPLLFPPWLPPPSSSVWHRSLALARVVSQLNYNGLAIFPRALIHVRPFFWQVSCSGLCFSKTFEFYSKIRKIPHHK